MPTVKVKYDKDEYYPYYCPLPVDYQHPYGEIEITELMYARWVDALEKFNQIQKEIGEIVDASRA